MKPTESDLKQMIEKTIADFDFEGVQRCVHALAPTFGTTSSIEEMQASVKRMFDDCLTLVMEYGMPIGKIARDGYEVTIDVTEDEEGSCKLTFIPVESEVWHCDIDIKTESVNPTLEKIDEFELQILTMIEELRQEISQPK